MSYLNFFSHEKINDELYILTEGYSAIHRMTIGLVAGSERILLIDTGYAMSDDLRRYVEGLVGTDREIWCVCTHLHPDHCSGAILLDRAFCSHIDYPASGGFAFSRAEREGDLEEVCLHNREVRAYAGEHLVWPSETYFEDIRDGDTWDLGGIEVTAIGLPGHTGGHMAFWIPKYRYLFPGDGINTDTHMSRMGREDYAKYRDTLQRCLDITGEDVIIRPAHLYLPMDVSVLKHLIRACDDIAGGAVKDDPPGDTMFSYRNLRKPNTIHMYIHYVENTGVTYDLSMTENEPHSGIYNFYSHEQVADHVYIVTENYSVVHHFTIGVIVGRDCILCIDSGLGMTDSLRAYIQSFAGKEKPLWCAVTAGAIEHVGGAPHFDRCFISAEDRVLLEDSCDSFRRRPALDDYALYEPRTQEYCREHMVETNAERFEDLPESGVFDLGDLRVEILPMPGNTPGSVMYYLPQEKILFAGEAVNAYIRLERLDRDGIGRYGMRLRRLLREIDPDTVLYPFHTNRPQGPGTIRSLAEACMEISDGKTYGDPPGETIFGRGENNPMIRVHYYGNCSVTYQRRLRHS